MELKEYLNVISKFIVNKLNETKMDGYVLGISGGIDSSLVAAITTKAVGKKLFGLLMPCESHPDDLKDAKILCERFDIDYAVVDLTDTYRVLKDELLSKAKESGTVVDRLSLINVKVRLRMVALYAYAQARHALVLGTDNADESYLGYFTKYGDGGVDLLPIVHLTKSEVREAAKLLGVPEDLVNRVPSAGLFSGQTDEGEMGIKYNDVDAYLLGKSVPEEVKQRIEHLHKVSNHKREPIPTPEKFIR